MTTLAPAALDYYTPEAGRLRMEDNLRLLNDVLETTPMAGRYWFFGGLLLGYVREGGIMLHDTKDADFAVHADDMERLEASFPALVEAGFVPENRFPGVTGEATEVSFVREGAKYEFFRVEVVGDRFRYCNYGTNAAGQTVQNFCEIPAQPLEDFRFLDRTWLKVRDADLELTALYGDWRTPRPSFDYMEGPTIVRRAPWDASTYNLWGQIYGR
jgi:hypothetical protein